MRRSHAFLVLFFVFLLYLVTVVSAQSVAIGVGVGDSFRYGSVSATWNSTDPDFTPGPDIRNFFDTDYMLLTITDVDIWETTIYMQLDWHFDYGTHETSNHYTNVDTGDKNISTFVICAFLQPGDHMYPGIPGSPVITEAVLRTYASVSRETNRITYSHTGQDYNSTIDMYMDQTTGALVEFNGIQTRTDGQYETTETVFIGITESNVWVVPEFPALIILPLFMIVTLLVSLGFRRNRKHSGTP